MISFLFRLLNNGPFNHLLGIVIFIVINLAFSNQLNWLMLPMYIIAFSIVIYLTLRWEKNKKKVLYYDQETESYKDIDGNTYIQQNFNLK